MWNYSQWNTQFYHQYLQQHARMTQWMQNVHQNLPCPYSSFHQSQPCIHQNHYQYQQLPAPVPQQEYYVPQQEYYVPQQEYYVPQQEYYVPQQGHHDRHQRHILRQQENIRHYSHHNPHQRSRSQTSNECDSDDVEEEEEDDGELVFNVDAILAFRATKEESEKEEDAVSVESFELVERVLDENFQFVELDDAGQMQKVIGRRIAPDAGGDVEYDRESRIVLFGDRADRIAGLETSLEIMFDHINDLQQPVVYPNV